jgi:hypothetical protein
MGPIRHEGLTIIAYLPLLCRPCLVVILLLPWATDLESSQIRGRRQLLPRSARIERRSKSSLPVGKNGHCTTVSRFEDWIGCDCRQIRIAPVAMRTHGVWIWRRLEAQRLTLFEPDGRYLIGVILLPRASASAALSKRHSRKTWKQSILMKPRIISGTSYRN